MIALKNTTNNQIFYIIHRRMDNEQGWDLMPLEVEYTENGRYSVVPPSGFDGFSSVNVTVDVDQSACNLTTSAVTLTGSGEHTITPPEGYDGFTEVIVNVENECDDRYDEGVADQKAKLTSTTFTENGSYSREDGWNAVQVNVDTVTPYNNGERDGIAEQKAKLTSLNVTQNGTYRREDGYNEVVVNVAGQGDYEDGRQDGIAEQKSKVSPINITANGTYSNEDGYSPVVVNVDTVTPYNNGYAAGEAAQKAKLISGTFTQNGTYSREDGYNQVIVNVDTQTPYDNGYADGYGDGEDDQKAKLGSITITENGTYTAENGYGRVVVSVDCHCDHLVLSKESIDMEYSGDFPIDGVDYQIGIYSSCTWNITNKPEWVTIDQITGTDGVSVINVKVNSLVDGRQGTITITNCEETKTITITQTDYEGQPLTFKATHSGCLYWKQYGIAYSRPLQLLRDDGVVYKTIYSIRENDGCLVACLSAGDTIRFRSTPTDQQSEDTYSYFVFADGLRGEFSGNLNDFFSPRHPLGTWGCYKLFRDCVGLESVEHLYIPEVAASYCKSMFSGCTSLVNAPKVLPAMTLAQDCYVAMFRECDSLTKAPELPATTLVNGCYNSMFYSCNNLNYVKALFTTTPGSSYTSSWLYGVPNTGTFVKNAEATWNVSGANGIPSGWTVETA